MRKKRESKCGLTEEELEALLIEVLKRAMNELHKELKETSK
jgi:hypothetical protein